MISKNVLFIIIFYGLLLFAMTVSYFDNRSIDKKNAFKRMMRSMEMVFAFYLCFHLALLFAICSIKIVKHQDEPEINQPEIITEWRE